MKVILTKDMENIGKAGTLVEVKRGYGRNYLIPNAIAVLATAKNVRQLDHEKAGIMARSAKVKASMTALANKLNAVEVKLSRKVGEQDKLFGSVTSKDVHEGLTALGYQIERRDLVGDVRVGIGQGGARFAALAVAAEAAFALPVAVAAAEALVRRALGDLGVAGQLHVGLDGPGVGVDVAIDLHRLVLHHVVGHAQVALKLGDDLRVAQVEEVDVDGAEALLHLVGRLLLAPVRHLQDLAAVALDDAAQALGELVDQVVGQVGPHQVDGLVLAQAGAGGVWRGLLRRGSRGRRGLRRLWSALGHVASPLGL